MKGEGRRGAGGRPIQATKQAGASTFQGRACIEGLRVCTRLRRHDGGVRGKERGGGGGGGGGGGRGHAHPSYQIGCCKHLHMEDLDGGAERMQKAGEACWRGVWGTGVSKLQNRLRQAVSHRGAERMQKAKNMLKGAGRRSKLSSGLLPGLDCR